jgi:hypothetical protein
MSSPRLRWIVLGFACLWFGMLVPVHQRGQIKLPGVAAAADAKPAPHCSRAAGPGSACHNTQQKQQTEQNRAPEQGGDCAVCHFIAGLHAAPPAVVCEARLGLHQILPAERSVVLLLRHPALPFHGLDPPLV